MNLSALILASLGVGIVFGALLNGFAPAAIAPLDHYLLTPLGRAFLRLVQFVVVPIVFSSLILGLTRVRDTAQVGRYILKLMASYMVTSGIAVCLGLTIAIFLQPGSGFTGLSTGAVTSAAVRPSMINWLISLIPVNPLQALSTGNLLQTIFAAALIGVGIQLSGKKATSFVALIESIYIIFEKVLSTILYTAPIGVFALISSVIATQGFGVISKLLFYLVGIFLGFSLMMALYMLILLVLNAKPAKFLQSFFPTFSLGFGTASTNAVLPIALQNAEESYGLNEAIASFAIPLGTALKRDGSAIFQGFNALFIAQIFQIPLTTDLLLAIGLSTFLVSFSTAGVPGSGIIMMTTVLSAAGLPLEGIAIVAGVDRFIDGFKTVLNITGNIVNAVILSRWEDASSRSISIPQVLRTED
ncbi:MAG: dicarboxylate/amino acid:cation symporter [Kovacikia sp.]